MAVITTIVSIRIQEINGLSLAAVEVVGSSIYTIVLVFGLRV